jgi:hypothetical protein
MQKTSRKANLIVLGMAAGLFLTAYVFLGGRPAGAEDAGGNQYVGSDKCKNCHAAAAKGDPYSKWQKSEHRKAFESLAGDEAKKFAKEKNIADPQKDKACVICHVTALDVPAAQKSKKFDQTQGVQCESCHGPGGNHVKARMEAEDAGDKVVQLPKGEMQGWPGPAVCKGCHNEKSPTYKAFNYVEFLKKIAHPDPRRNHPADYIEKGAEQFKSEETK